MDARRKMGDRLLEEQQASKRNNHAVAWRHHALGQDEPERKAHSRRERVDGSVLRKSILDHQAQQMVIEAE